MSCDNEATRGFGPLLPGHLKVDFGDEVALEKIFKGLNKPNILEVNAPCSICIVPNVCLEHLILWIINSLHCSYFLNHSSILLQW